MCGCMKCAPTCICPCHRPPWPLRTYHLHPKTGTVHMDQASLTYSSLDTCPVYEKRAVAVVDPEDRDQVRELLATYGRQFTNWTPELDSNVTRLQAALREFANSTPPKPEEPQGLGAVVEDTEGLLWIRQGDGRLGSPWYRRNAPGVPRHCSWDEIAAVKILSEGVQS